jgi:monoamine oxidase
MMKNTILIIGAGAAGLVAARTLAKAGKKVTVLEARSHIGGRIHTLSDQSFFSRAELGAEFIHGDLPVTLGLLKEASIAAEPATAEMWQHKDGKFVQEEQQVDGWDLVMKTLANLREDMPIATFLEKYFADDKYTEVKRSVIRFVSGYDTADPTKASAFALRNEWQNEDDDAQHRIPEGYCSLISYLADECKANGGTIELNAIAKEIHWEAGKVRAITTDGTEYAAAQVIIALPLGVLQAEENQQGAISFQPPIPGQLAAINQIGFGAIIKILLQFDAPFWEDTIYGDIKESGFLFTDEAIPTWWTQGESNALLTGWLGGGPAVAMKDKSAEEIWLIAMQSLCNAFGLDIDYLKGHLIAWRVANWTNEPFTRGSYAYDMVGSNEAREILNQSVEHTLFFAGEYLYSGPAMGTVEAALDCGVRVAGMI